MSEPLSVAKQALLALEQMRERLAAAEQAVREPIAIVGIGLRVPGASDLESFWTLLRDGVDATSEVPRDRWDVNAFFDPDPDAAGKVYTKRGGFIADVDRFDAEFFGVSPREARSMDPQQRLLLEVAWEAIEHAGVAPADLSGSRTGVFVGITVDDYMQMIVESGDRRLLDAYAHHGNVFNAAAGRLSYVLGLHGPSMAIDTACSSSLVAMHVACQSLRSRDCDAALAGGVNLVLSPLCSVRLARGHMLAPDGRCKTFDASADGYARGEGCGMLLLKRLSTALAEGDRVLAVIRGSAVNQDGHTSALTVPSGLAQRSVIRDALASAGVDPVDVAYVEAHGTGTSLGDPIEMDAIADVLGSGRRTPLLVGSVKTNIGHLESASGVAGVIKVVLALQHGLVPPHLHFRTPSPHIPWGDLAVRVPTEVTEWPPEARRIAGVSSFGASGTNAHLLLEQAPGIEAPIGEPDRPHHLLVLSAESDSALRTLAARYARHFDAHPDLEARDVCATAAVGRTHFMHRAAIVGRDVGELRRGVSSLADGGSNASVERGAVDRGVVPKIAFLFTGQGSQYWGMGRELFDTEPTFRAGLEECGRALQAHLDVPLLSLLYDEVSNRSRLLDQTMYTQPALFAVEYALARMLASWGVVPSAVIGHSVGEFAAACAAGVLALSDAARLVAVRGRLMQSLPEGGAMVAIAAEEAAVRRVLSGYLHGVAVAAVNAPDQIVLSGDRTLLDVVLAELGPAGQDGRWLAVSHAFHSPLLQPMLDALEREASAVPHSPPRVPFVSNLTGSAIQAIDGKYWRDHAAMPVRFADGVVSVAALGCSVFVEIGPTPALLPLAQRSVDGSSAAWIPTLRRGRGDWSQILKAVGALYVRGASIDWRAFSGRRRPVTLPAYPFARERYWFEAGAGDERAGAFSPDHDSSRTSSRPASPGRYAIVWRRTSPASSLDGQDRGLTAAAHWVVLTSGTDPGAVLADSLRSRGAAVIEVAPGAAFHRAGATNFVLRPESGEDFDVLCRAVAAETDGTAMFVHAWGAKAAPVPEPSTAWVREYARWSCGSLLNLTQSLGRTGIPARLCVLTAGAVDVGAGSLEVACHQSSLWGLARTIAREQPELRCLTIDLDPSGAVGDPSDMLLADVGVNRHHDEVAYRAGERYVARLVAEASGADRGAFSLSGDATYLVTGGAGGAGFATAEWLAARGARHLALMGRSQPTADTESGIRRLRDIYSADARIVRADVADEDQLARALALVGSTMPPVRGVVHAAGVLADGVLREQSWPQFERVLAPKVLGAWNLHRLLHGVPLDFFVLFSSFAGLAGSAGQANYTAANAFLDGLAQHRKAQGLPATSVAWGPWQVGMLASLQDTQRERWRRQGLRPMAPEAALSSLDAAITGGRPLVAVLDVDWPLFLAANRRERDLLFAEVGPAAAVGDRAAVPAAAGNDLFDQIATAPVTRRRIVLVDAIGEQARVILGATDAKRLDPRRPLRELGMDSLMAVEIRNAIGARLGRTLPATLLFDYPAIEGVADYVLRTFFADARPAASGPAADAAPNPARVALDLDDLDNLSADEAEKLLLAELNAAED